MEIETLSEILRASISPCILISGLGLLLLSLANRFARPIDRIYMLMAELRKATGKDILRIKRQIEILFLRSQILRASIGCVILATFFVSLIIFMLFSIYIFGVSLEAYVQIAFILSLVSTIACLVLFLIDVSLALKSLRMAVDEVKKFNQ